MNIAAEYAAEDQYTKVHQRNNNVNYVKKYFAKPVIFLPKTLTK